MSDSVSPEDIAVIRALFFERLAATNRDLVQIFGEITLQIDKRNHLGVLGVLIEIEDRIQAMRTILIVFRECLEG